MENHLRIGTTKASISTRYNLYNLVAAALLSPLAAMAQPGGLDPEFDGDGKVTVSFNGHFGVSTQSKAQAIAISADGKILTAGSVDNGSTQFLSVARQNPDGSLDTGFGAEGLNVVGSTPGANAEAKSLLMLPDGKILTGGFSDSETQTGAFLVRFDTDGNFDAFNSEIIVDPTFGIVDMELQDDGKIVAALRPVSGTPTTQAFVVARFFDDGSLDTGFGTNGVAVVDLGSSPVEEYSQSLALQGDKIVVGGVFWDDLAIIRLNANGSLDTSFGNNGRFILGRSGSQDAADLTVRNDGKILLAGFEVFDGLGNNILVLRTTTDGILDTTFASGSGVFVYGPSTIYTPSAMALQTDQKILLGGYSRLTFPSTNFRFSLTRLNENGTLDGSFGNNGSVNTDFGSPSQAHAIAVQADTKIVLAGYSAGASSQNFAIARYLSQGAEADLSLVKEASADAVIVGTEFDYTLTIGNAGPGDANSIVVTDTLPTELNYVSCSAPDGSCSFDGTDFTAQFDSLASGNNHQVTFTVQMDASAPVGVDVENTASVSADETDPDLQDNSDTASVLAEGAPHKLRFYLHGDDVPETAGGYTMDLNPPSSAPPLGLNLANGPSWYSEPALDGDFVAGDFVLQHSCAVGLSLSTTYTLYRTALDGSNPQTIGSVSQPLSICTGNQTVNIPVNAAETFTSQRLRLQISTLLGLSLSISMEGDEWLETTDFVGTP